MTLTIRLARDGDGDALARIYRLAVTESSTSFEVEPPDGAEMMRRAARVMERTPWLVAEREGEVVGYAYAGTHRERAAYRWTVEVSAYIDARAQRSGIGKALYAELFERLVTQRYRNAVAGVTLPNDASVALHRAMGFQPVGVYHAIGYKFGAWHDVAWFERAILPPVDEPEEPLPLRIEP